MTVPSEVEPGRLRGRGSSGTRKRPATRPTITTGTLIRKTEPHQKCSSSQPPVTGPMATPRPETPAQMPMALARSAGSVKTLVRMDRVAGMISAPPMPMNARAPMSAPAEPLKAATTEPTPKIGQAGGQGAAAAELVAEGAGGEQEAGEDQDVGVDDPLLLAGGGVQVLDERGQGDVQDGGVEADDEQADAEHGERPPSAAVDRGASSVGSIRPGSFQKRLRFVSTTVRPASITKGKRFVSASRHRGPSAGPSRDGLARRRGRPDNSVTPPS